MKKSLLSLVAAMAVISTLSASDIAQSDNTTFCSELNEAMPSVVTIGLDAFAIRDGKTSKCEEHSKDEWQTMATTAEYSFLMAVNYSMPSIYTKLVSKAKESKTNDLTGLQKLLEDGALYGEFIDATKTKDKI